MTTYKNSNIRNMKKVTRRRENRRLSKSDGVIKQNQISRRESPAKEREVREGDGRGAQASKKHFMKIIFK